MSTLKKPLSVFALVMINVIAVDSIKNLPLAATFGLSLVTLYVLVGLCFFLPTALVTAELATMYPHEKGGAYVWVREAFGPRFGFTVVWVQWIYNVIWYPSILTLVAGTFLHFQTPGLGENPHVVLGLVLGFFSLCTLLNFFGMRISSWVSTLGALLGTLLPIGLMIGMGAYAFFVQDHPIAFTVDAQAWLPPIHQPSDLVFILAIMFSLLGLEMSAVHANEVQDPAKDYPRALLISAVIILASLTLGALAIAAIVPAKELNVITGTIQALTHFLTLVGYPQLAPYLGGCIILGGIGAVATWIIGPTKGLLAAAEDGLTPEWMQHKNRWGVPTYLLLAQWAIGCALSGAFLLLPTVMSSYWFLSALSAQLALVMYLFVFAAVLKLRYSHPNKTRPAPVPGGKLGIWCVASLGIFSSVAAIVLGFLPPTDMVVDVYGYSLALIIGIVLFLVPVLFLKNKSKHRQYPSHKWF